jgi:penicillin amidase
LRKLGRLFIWIFTVLLVAVAITVWYFLYRPLPLLDGTLSVPGLKAQVTVDRDNWGVPHVRASSLEDAAEAQGYVMAQDRLFQLDLLRRASRGQLSEIVGPLTLKTDETFRTLGFGRIADREFAVMDNDARTLLTAYSRGVNAFLATHQNNLPLEFSLLHYQPQPWQPTDSLVIAGYMYQTLTSTWERELDRAQVQKIVGPDRAKDLYSDEAEMDRYVIGDPDNPNDGWHASKANGQEDQSDDEDDDEMVGDTVIKTSAGATRNHARQNRAAASPADLTSALALSINTYLAESQADIRAGLGSNNWVVSGDYTDSGKPLLANDTHLELSIPPIWYEIHLTAPNYNAKGFTLPGAPLIVIGHNDHIAWGFTNNGADVQDLYIETFNPAARDQYKVNGKWVQADVFDEVIHVKNQPDVQFPATITRHGPIVQEENGQRYALKWTALEPGGLGNTYNWMSKANNWHEFKEVMKRVWGPAQNAVYADVDGNIGYLMAARVPIRKKGHGEVPVPGDSDDYEWTGYIPFEQLPHALNPDDGLVVTANARVVGPLYKPYLTDRWEEPYRTARIHDLLDPKNNLNVEDILKVQTDTYSYPEFFLGNQLVAAAKSHPPHDPRAQQFVSQAKDWNGIADADSALVSFLVTLRRAALNAILEPYLGPQSSLYTWRSTTFLQRILTDRPSKWLPPAYKNYDELLSASADRAVEMLAEESRSDHVSAWQWQNFDSLDMFHPLGRSGLLKSFLSITGKPQSGTRYSIRAATRTHGPSMRFIADLSNWDNSLMLLPAGQSGQPASSHYTDQFSYWYEGHAILSTYSAAAESKSRRHTLTLTP